MVMDAHAVAVALLEDDQAELQVAFSGRFLVDLQAKFPTLKGFDQVM